MRTLASSTATRPLACSNGVGLTCSQCSKSSFMQVHAKPMTLQLRRVSQLLSRHRALCIPWRPHCVRLATARSSAAGAGELADLQTDGNGSPSASEPRQEQDQEQPGQQPGVLHQQLARVHLESNMRGQDFRRSMNVIDRHLMGKAPSSSPRRVFLTWLALPFLLAYIAMRHPVQLLIGFHRERLIRLRLLRWIARRSVVLKLSKATQADPANAEKYVHLRKLPTHKFVEAVLEHYLCSFQGLRPMLTCHFDILTPCQVFV